jgi:catechol 2,3-dioxygenase-like lactoylglutathione lyase family enzyme
MASTHIDASRRSEDPVSRVQLALNVSDLEAAIDFYGALFGGAPAKVRPSYANFTVADPPLKLVLIEGGEGGSLNHLGVEVASTGDVAEAADRLAARGLPTDERAAETCCYAVQDKVWVHDPDGAPWEVYTVLEDAGTMTADVEAPTTAACCSRVRRTRPAAAAALHRGER